MSTKWRSLLINNKVIVELDKQQAAQSRIQQGTTVSDTEECVEGNETDDVMNVE